MATAMGDCTPPMVDAASDVGGEGWNNSPRLISETLLDPKLATRATPVASLTATPIGLVPTATSGTASVLVSKFTTETVAAVLLATTAIPRCELIPTP